MQRQARALLSLGAAAVLLKGGHAPLAEALDVLVLRDGGTERFVAVRAARSCRGTGCALSSAIAAGIARGLDLRLACADAKQHVGTLFSDEG
jgi:hydroxymethylpyrimidine/phosphomethylpyrimidine kinase